MPNLKKMGLKESEGAKTIEKCWSLIKLELSTLWTYLAIHRRWHLGLKLNHQCFIA